MGGLSVSHSIVVVLAKRVHHAHDNSMLHGTPNEPIHALHSPLLHHPDSQ